MRGVARCAGGDKAVCARAPGARRIAAHLDGAGVIYILTAQNLSEQSASDAEHLIREVQLRAVVTQVVQPALEDVRIEEDCLTGNGDGACWYWRPSFFFSFSSFFLKDFLKYAPDRKILENRFRA
jgi:hypothetical protein